MPDENNNIDTRIEHTDKYMLRLTTETGDRTKKYGSDLYAVRTILGTTNDMTNAVPIFRMQLFLLNNGHILHDMTDDRPWLDTDGRLWQDTALQSILDEQKMRFHIEMTAKPTDTIFVEYDNSEPKPIIRDIAGAVLSNRTNERIARIQRYDNGMTVVWNTGNRPLDDTLRHAIDETHERLVSDAHKMAYHTALDELTVIQHDGTYDVYINNSLTSEPIPFLELYRILHDLDMNQTARTNRPEIKNWLYEYINFKLDHTPDCDTWLLTLCEDARVKLWGMKEFLRHFAYLHDVELYENNPSDTEN